MHCSWTVEVDSNAIIRFQVLYVEIQFIHGCKGADYLEVSLLLFVIIAADGMICGDHKKSPRTSPIVQILSYFWSFELK